jgi:hypothetical protein
VGCYGSSALAAAAVDGVVGAGPAVAVWWLLGYSRRGISPTLGDSACAAVRGCVLGCSQWGISLPLAAPGLGNRQHDLGNALRAARRAATASATSPLLWSCGMPAVCVFGGGVHVPFVRSVLAATAPARPGPRAPLLPTALIRARAFVLQPRALLAFARVGRGRVGQIVGCRGAPASIFII